jgi:CMP-N-acetylneuraminic acid synthetase
MTAGGPITAIIPARGGSMRIPGKNIIDINGHPLIAYTIASAKLSTMIEKVVLTTDDPEIASVGEQYGAEVPFLRPKEISGDNSTDFEFFSHYVNFCDENGIDAGEYLVQLRPSTPFRDPQIIDEGICHILGDLQASSMRSAYKSSFCPYKVFKMRDGCLEGFFPEDPRPEYHNLARQNFPDTYIPNGYVDVVRVSVIRKGLLFGSRILGFIAPDVPDIDEPSDVEYAKKFLNENDFSMLTKYMDGCLCQTT